MSPTVKAQVLDILGRQQAALETAIERGNVGMQTSIPRRMEVLERALDNDARRDGCKWQRDCGCSACNGDF